MRPNGSTPRSSSAGWRLAPVALATALVVLLAAASPASAAQSQSDTVHIDPGEHKAVRIDFRDGPTKDVSYDVRVTEGPNIDVMVLDNANYDTYRNGQDFDYVQDWSDLDTGNTGTTFRLDTHGTWWLVLDHTGEPDEGTSPATIGAESVTARYTVESKTNVTDTAKDRFQELPGPGLLVAAGLLGSVALAASRREL